MEVSIYCTSQIGNSHVIKLNRFIRVGHLLSAHQAVTVMAAVYVEGVSKSSPIYSRNSETAKEDMQLECKASRCVCVTTSPGQGDAQRISEQAQCQLGCVCSFLTLIMDVKGAILNRQWDSRTAIPSSKHCILLVK